MPDSPPVPDQTANVAARLFQPLNLRGVTFKNRIVIAPMCQYSAQDGVATEWHFAHHSGFAMGGAACIFFEASAVEPRGRITHGDLGIWSDAHRDALKPTVRFIQEQGALAAIQIVHAGRKASIQRPWEGNGPMDAADATRGELPWEIVAPSAIPLAEGSLLPAELSPAEIKDIRDKFVAAAGRAVEAGFDVLEIHGAHGYLLHSFLSPISNHRSDTYGGDRAGRMRFPLEVAAAVRDVWPADKPLFFRISAIDAVEEGGWQLEDSVAFAYELKARGIDVVDCSSGGIGGSVVAARILREPGFQVPFAETIRREADMATMAVGLILTPGQAETILEAGQADLIAIAREALYNPFWPRHTAYALGADPEFADWPQQYGWYLERRERTLVRPD